MQGVLDGAGFPARVTAHFVAVEGQARPRTTILIKFAEEVRLDSHSYCKVFQFVFPML
jgi:hypothetical protein